MNCITDHIHTCIPGRFFQRTVIHRLHAKCIQYRICLKFLHTYAKRIEVLDAKELGLSVIDPAVVDYFNHSLFNNVYPIYNHALAETRQHPLTTRRYMWKVAY